MASELVRPAGAVVLRPISIGPHWRPATDYPGLGTPGVHAYLMGESEGRAVLDSVRAARNLPD
jgi:hypothetical protein